jgi:hypothetical protein
MDDIINKLKKLADNIQDAKLGKRGKENHINSFTVIDEYQEWRAESENLFEKYFDTSNSLYSKFKSLPRDGNGHTLLGYFLQQYQIFKILVNKIEAGETMKTEKITPREEFGKEDGKSIFISHASLDKEIADAFVDLILQGALSVPINQIFCVSTDGTKIESGADWRDTIKENLLSAKINFLIVTSNYKESEVCLNEMGAAWVTSAKVIPLIVEPIDYKTVGIIQEPTQIEKLLNENSLDRIRDSVQESLNIPSNQIRSDRWTVKKKEFLSKVKRYIASNPFQIPVDRDAFNGLIKENIALNKTVDNLIEEKDSLESLIRDLVKAKDKNEVKDAIKKHKPNSDYDEFLNIVEDAKEQLDKFSPIIRGVIFREYTGKNIGVKFEGYREDIDEAIAEDYIDDELNADWRTTVQMKDIYNSLNEISEILEETIEEDFNERFSKDFKSPQKIDNISFWKEVFETNINF